MGPDGIGGLGLEPVDDTIVLLGEGSEGPPVGSVTSDPAPNVYIAAGTANIVPVEFVASPGVGIVRARLVGAPGVGVVPVREANTEIPRIQICLAP